MVAKVSCITPIGFNGALVEVESDAKRGLPSLQIVGLGSKAIDESRERVRSAITNSLLDFPTNKIVINLAPAELPKDGTHFDLAIALAILCSSGQLTQTQLNGSIYIGELALDGNLRPVKGIINIAEATKKSGFSKLYVPSANANQAQLISGLEIYPVNTLKELFLHLKGEVLLSPLSPPIKQSPITSKTLKDGYILDNIIGQDHAKRALTIATAGRHNILFNGPPGSGKTLLAKTLTQLLPVLSDDEIVAVTKIHNLAGEAIDSIIYQRPFRAPHHTTSRTALIGGGSKPQPGEISLAHHGVLFLDEIPEYSRATLESLRQPLEDKVISVSRTAFKTTYPADFMLVATMNPCPCGFYGDTSRECSCSANQILLYQKKLSGPLLDRIDMVINVNRLPTSDFLTDETQTNTQHKTALNSISKAQNAQVKRYNSSSKYNSLLTSKEIVEKAQLSLEAKNILDIASDKLSLSARGYFKTIKVARTIADIDNSETVRPPHIAEALQYRQNTV